MRNRKKNREILQYLPVSQIWPNPCGARRTFSSDGIRALASSLEKFGMISPLVVRPSGKDFELVAGERRLRAARLLEWERVPCRVLPLSLRSAAEFSLAENWEREELGLFEEAAALERMLKSFHSSSRELGERTGLAPSVLAGKLRLLRFTPLERRLIEEKSVSPRLLSVLLRVEDPKIRLAALKRLSEKGSDSGAAELLSPYLSPTDEILRAPKEPLPPLRRFVVKDLGFFLNSVDRAIGGIREAGFSVEAEKSEGEEFVSYSIRIPKNTP